MTKRNDVDLDLMPADGKDGTVYLLTIRGTIKSASYETARPIHNQTAGNPEGVATCRSLGDLSHNVYVPMAPAKPLELLILDRWTSVQGLGKFFSDPRVSEGGSMIFESRDPVVWAPVDAIPAFALPAPATRSERYVGLFRGKMKDRDKAIDVWASAIRKNLNLARLHGQCSEQTFIRAPEPGGAPSTEMLGVAVWHDADGMNAFYRETGALGFFDQILAAPPTTSVWRQAPGEWTEW